MMDTLTLPAKQENLATLVAFIKNAVEKHGGNPKDIYQFHLVSEEIILNIIKYAYPEKTGDIEIKYEFKPKGNPEAEQGTGGEVERKAEMMIRISDQGIPFNPLEKDKPDISVPVDQRDIGGLGIFMVRNLVDHLSYERQNNQNVLILIKQLTC